MQFIIVLIDIIDTNALRVCRHCK